MNWKGCQTPDAQFIIQGPQVHRTSPFRAIRSRGIICTEPGPLVQLYYLVAHLEMTRRPEFDFLYPRRSNTDVVVSRSTTTASVENQATTTKEDMEEGDLLLEAYVHRSRTEELEKRLNLQQSTHFTAAADLQAR